MDSSKNYFFGYFGDFQDFPMRFLSILGPFWVPVGSCFWWFFWVQFCTQFLTIFPQKYQKLKKRKSSFRIVKYSVSWGSPVWKKHARMWKNTSVFSLFFHEKSTKNQSKNREKRHLPQKSTKKRSLEHPFSPKVDFWSIFGSQMGLKIDATLKPKKSRKKDSYSSIHPNGPQLQVIVKNYVSI